MGLSPTGTSRRLSAISITMPGPLTATRPVFRRAAASCLVEPLELGLRALASLAWNSGPAPRRPRARRAIVPAPLRLLDLRDEHALGRGDELLPAERAVPLRRADEADDRQRCGDADRPLRPRGPRIEGRLARRPVMPAARPRGAPQRRRAPGPRSPRPARTMTSGSSEGRSGSDGEAGPGGGASAPGGTPPGSTEPGVGRSTLDGSIGFTVTGIGVSAPNAA